ncbi:MAG: glycosyltransferase [Solidesulfovibrio sp.]
MAYTPPVRRGKSPGHPRILMLSFDFFLEQELAQAAARLCVPFTSFAAKTLGREYLPKLFERILAFKPDFIFSTNMQGLDDDGRLLELLAKRHIAFATWFVDSPEHYLPVGKTLPANLAVFAVERDALPLLRERGCLTARYLPLAADAGRFDLGADLFVADGSVGVSFVGTNWIEKLALCFKNVAFPAFVRDRYQVLGAALAARPQASVRRFLEAWAPDFLDAAEAALTPNDLRHLFILLCWEANRVSRQRHIEQLLPFRPLIVGDDHWPTALAGHAGRFVHHPPLGYYEPDLAELYRRSRVNFATSSVQLPTSVTQRVFDVPAAGGLVVTDRRPQLLECFEEGLEAWVYDGPEAIADAVGRGLSDRLAARKVVNAARKRIQTEHTYDHRLCSIMETMRAM